MSFTWLGAGAFVAGLAALAAVLFALQRLRVRHRDVTVVTTLFWREAIEETRARVFVQRFRHPLAYLLVLAICALVWLAIAGPRAGGEARAHVLVVDGSAGMGWGDRFQRALAAARERAAELPRASTSVVLAGARCTTLLARGEPLPLLERRSANLAPEACPATARRAIEDLLALERPHAGLALELFGDAPIGADVLALLPSDVKLVRADLGAAPRSGNAGIVALGVTEAASGAWDEVDLFCAVAGDTAKPASLVVDGAARAWDVSESSDGRVQLVARALPARGGLAEVRVGDPDAFARDDVASIVLPMRAPIRVALSPNVPPIVKSALEADSGVALVSDEPEVVVRAAGEDFGADRPALELTDEATQPAAFVVRRPDTADAERGLRSSFEELGLAEIDSTELAEIAARPIELSLESADRRAVAVWRTLLEPRYDFAQSRAFPLFLARSVRWLAGTGTIAFECAAGEELGDGTPQVVVDPGLALDGFGREIRVPRAGEISTPNGRVLRASLLDLGATLAASDDALAPTSVAGGAAVDPLVWIVLLALVLLAIEWWLVRTERIP